MNKPKTVTLTVVIRQTRESTEAGKDFGSSGGWAEYIRHRLERVILLADVVSVTPRENDPEQKAKASA